jgi:hypothetical protein
LLNAALSTGAQARLSPPRRHLIVPRQFLRFFDTATRRHPLLQLQTKECM